jgi:hypothetical protein
MHEKSKFNFSLLLFVGPGSGIRDKRRSDPDPGYQKMGRSGSGIRDKHPGSATLIPDPDLQHWLHVHIAVKQFSRGKVAEKLI